jgi:hypothetical protein
VLDDGAVSILQRVERRFVAARATTPVACGETGVIEDERLPNYSFTKTSTQ